MTAEYEEVCTKGLYIHRCMGDALSTIDEHRDVVRVCDVDDTSHIVDGAESVIYMPHTHKTGPRCDESFQFREDEVAVLVCGDSA